MKVFLFKIVYTTILVLFFPLGIFLLLKNKKGKPRVGKRWVEYFGVIDGIPSSPMWIHAASVGEVIAAKSVVISLRNKYPDTPILITTTTTTGCEQVSKLFSTDDLVYHRYIPIDFSICIRIFLNKVHPKVFIIMETELWPNTLLTVHSKRIPIYLVNGRLSDKSYDGYRKIPVLKDIICKSINKVFAQYSSDKQNFMKLGFSSGDILITGSVKADINIEETVYTSSINLRHQLGIDNFIWVAASTHPGEDEIVLTAHKKLLETVPHAKLILVARHPERFNSLSHIVNSYGLTSLMHTDNNGKDIIDQSVYVGNVMGELLVFISASNVCFIGGSLLGEKVGGHNVLEPAALKKPILIGPSYFNFKSITDELIDLGCCHVCNNAMDIFEHLVEYSNNQFVELRHGDLAKSYIDESRGAVSKIVDSLDFY